MPLISEDGEDDSDRTKCNITGKGVNEISWYIIYLNYEKDLHWPVISTKLPTPVFDFSGKAFQFLCE